MKTTLKIGNIFHDICIFVMVLFGFITVIATTDIGVGDEEDGDTEEMLYSAPIYDASGAWEGFVTITADSYGCNVEQKTSWRSSIISQSGNDFSIDTDGYDYAGKIDGAEYIYAFSTQEDFGIVNMNGAFSLYSGDQSAGSFEMTVTGSEDEILCKWYYRTWSVKNTGSTGHPDQFSVDYLNGKTFYRLHYESNGDDQAVKAWTCLTCRFTESEIFVDEGIVADPQRVIIGYDIVEDGIVRTIREENTGYLKTTGSTKYYLYVCGIDTLKDLSNCTDENRDTMLFFDKAEAQRFLNTQNQAGLQAK